MLSLFILDYSSEIFKNNEFFLLFLTSIIRNVSDLCVKDEEIDKLISDDFYLKEKYSHIFKLN